MLCTGTKSEMAHVWAQWLPNPCCLRSSQCSAQEKIRNGPHVGTVATQPLPSRGSPMLCTGTKSEMAHMWAQWLPNPCRLGSPRCSAWEQNQKWPTCGHSGYLTPAVSGVPDALHGHKIRNGPHVGTVATQPLPSRGSPMLCTGTKSEMAHMWAQWLPNPCCLGGLQCSAREHNQKWPTCGHSGYLTPAVSGVPNALHGHKIRNGPHVGTVATQPLPSQGSPMLCTGTKSEMAHMWAQWLPNPCCLGGPQCSAREQNQKWPTCGHSGYLTPAVTGVPNALLGNKIRNGHTCGHSGYLTPAVSGVPNALHGNKIRNGPHVGTVAT